MNLVPRISPLCCALFLLFQSCVAPKRAPASGPRLEYANPDAMDVIAGTGLAANDLRGVTRWIADAMHDRLNPRADGAAWKVRLERPRIHTAAWVDPMILTDQIATEVNRKSRGLFELYSAAEEEDLYALRQEQLQGLRHGEIPAPELVMPDLVLYGDVRGIEHNNVLGVSRYYSFVFKLQDPSSRVIWAECKDFQKRESRSPAHR